MSFPGSPNRTLPNDDYLQQRFGKVSLSNEAQDDLYVRNDGSYSMPSTTNETHTDPVGSNWDCTTPQTRNSDAVVGELTPEEVRWFYKCDGEKRWLEFSGYDSLHIEMKYREIFERSKFSAFSDQTTKPSGSHFNFPGSSSYFGASSIRFPSKPSGNQYIQQTNKFGDPQHLQHKIVVRGGLYDINFETWKCSSIYWPGEECLIMRGTWFYEGTWQPLEQEHSQILESKHLTLFQGHKLSEFAENEIKGNVMHTETFPEFIVEWISPNQIYLYSENTPSKVVRTVSTRLGFRKSSGYRLFRGYKCEASVSDRPDVEITHLVFVIHGIGQKMDTGRIIRNTSSFRDCVSWLKQKYFSNFPNHRAEFFPVEWRSNLQLDGDLVDAITPNTLHSLRQMLNASAMDIMYYTSPLYGGEVQRGLREELNRLYSMFSARNPYFMNKRGKISIIAHSLGCVILYDIIMGLKPGSLVQNNQQGLLFQVQNFFCLGSPLSVFLALRWKDSQIPGKMGVILPQRLCHRLYNVFHPTDPVAYRIEPLLVKGYAKVAPLVVQPYNASFRTPYSEMPIEIIVPEQQTTTVEAAAMAQDTGSSSQPGNNKEEYSPGGTPKDKSWSLWGLRNKGSRRSQDGSSLEPLQEGLEYRLDYILRESNLGVSYLSALTSHTAYWTNYDVAYFILTQIFPEFEKNDPSLYASDKNYSDKFNSYSQGYHSQPLSYNYEDRNYSQYDGNRTSYEEQDVVRHPVPPPPHPLEPGIYGQPPPPRFQPPGYVERQEYNQPYSHSPPAPLQQNSQNVPSFPQHPGHQNYPQSHQMGSYQPSPQPSVQGYQKPQDSYGCYQQPPQAYSLAQGYQPVTTSSVSGYQHQPSLHHSHQQPQPIQQLQQQQQLPGYQQQQQPPGYKQLQQQNPPSYQQQNYQQEHSQQSYQQSPQNFQGSLSTAGPLKQVQTKTGFFEKMTEEKKPQGAGSPTKSTKSFFPTFNLSSLTSPVKNLSNSLSNISNQMTNIASSKDSIGSNSSNVQNRSPSSGLLGNVAPTRNMSPSYNQPNRTQSPQVQFTQGHFGQTQYQQPSTGPNQFPTQQNIRSSSPYEGVQLGSMAIRSGSPRNQATTGKANRF